MIFDKDTEASYLAEYAAGYRDEEWAPRGYLHTISTKITQVLRHEPSVNVDPHGWVTLPELLWHCQRLKNARSAAARHMQKHVWRNQCPTCQ